MMVTVLFGNNVIEFSGVTVKVNNYGTLEVTDNITSNMIGKFTAPFGYFTSQGASDPEFIKKG
jgi:hypothetical protein